MFNLDNRVALVTGAMRGMGAADAKALAKQGARVAVTDIDKDTCQEVVDEIEAAGGEAVAYKMDVTNKSEIDEVVADVVDRFGKLDILVNNAGVYTPKEADTITEDEWEKLMSVNLKGQFLCAQRAAREMRKNGWGRIINIGSVASGQTGIGIAGGAHYTASKGGVLGMTEALASEWADDGILVNAVAPGAIDTPMLQSGANDESIQAMMEGVPLGRVGTPEEIAAAVVFLASEEASYMTGSVVYVDGGWLAS